MLQSRDRHLLEELGELRVVDREQASRIASFNSVARANARLLALSRAGFLRHGLIGTLAGGRKAIYTLPTTTPFVRRSLNKDSSLPTAALQHQLAVNDLYVAARYPKAGLPLGNVLHWQRFTAPISATMPLIPDGLAQLEREGRRYHFFVEVDRATESLGVWRRKVERYIHGAASGSANTALGIDRFGVIVATDSPRRLTTVSRVVRALTHRLFWFAVIESIKRDGFWSSVWFRSDGDQRQSIL